MAEVLQQLLQPGFELNVLSVDAAQRFPALPGTIWLVDSELKEQAALCRELRDRADRPRVLLTGNHRYPNKAVRDPFELPVPYVGTPLLPLWLTNLISA